MLKRVDWWLLKQLCGLHFGNKNKNKNCFSFEVDERKICQSSVTIPNIFKLEKKNWKKEEKKVKSKENTIKVISTSNFNPKIKCAVLKVNVAVCTMLSAILMLLLSSCQGKMMTKAASPIRIYRIERVYSLRWVFYPPSSGANPIKIFTP